MFKRKTPKQKLVSFLQKLYPLNSIDEDDVLVLDDEIIVKRRFGDPLFDSKE